MRQRPVLEVLDFAARDLLRGDIAALRELQAARPESSSRLPASLAFFSKWKLKIVGLWNRVLFGIGEDSSARRPSRSSQEEEDEDARFGWALALGLSSILVPSVRSVRRYDPTERLRIAMAAYQSAVGDGTRERSPQRWVRIQATLGRELLAAGEISNDPELLQKAAFVLKAALDGSIDSKLQSAMILGLLGVALRSLGEHQNNMELLVQAIRSFRSALNDISRHRFAERALVQVQLGIALSKLGTQQNDARVRSEAETLLRGALQEYSKGKIESSAERRKVSSFESAFIKFDIRAQLAKILVHEPFSTDDRVREAIATYRAGVKELEAVGIRGPDSTDDQILDYLRHARSYRGFTFPGHLLHT